MVKRKLVPASDDASSHKRHQLIHPFSQPSSKSELTIDTVPPTQTAIVKGYNVEYRPIAALTGDAPLVQFVIPASMDQYTDLDDTRLFVRMKFTGYKTGGNGAKEELKGEDLQKLAPVNNLLHSLWDKVDVFINDKLVSSSTHYPFTAYLEKLVGYGKEAKETYLRGAGWTRDTDFEVNTKSPYKSGVTFELFDKLHHGLANQSRLLISGVPIKISLQANKPEFYLQGTNDVVSVKVEWLQVGLEARHAKLSDYQIMLHEAQLAKTGALYPISRNEIRQFIIPSNTKQISLDNVVNGQVPRRILVAMLPNASENGTLLTNPFKFQHFKFNHLSCQVNGEQFPSIAYEPDFENDLCLREYMAFFSSMNDMHAKPVCDITFEEFKSGYTIIPFNLTPDLADGCDGHLNLIKRGSVRVDVKLAAAFSSVISVLLFCEFDNIIHIDKDRNVTTDY